ncbi:hypothetical protein C8F04DRAFT_425955, partial [Mycena alexandri]
HHRRTVLRPRKDDIHRESEAQERHRRPIAPLGRPCTLPARFAAYAPLIHPLPPLAFYTNTVQLPLKNKAERVDNAAPRGRVRLPPLGRLPQHRSHPLPRTINPRPPNALTPPPPPLPLSWTLDLQFLGFRAPFLRSTFRLCRSEIAIARVVGRAWRSSLFLAAARPSAHTPRTPRTAHALVSFPSCLRPPRPSSQLVTCAPAIHLGQIFLYSIIYSLLSPSFPFRVLSALPAKPDVVLRRIGSAGPGFLWWAADSP